MYIGTPPRVALALQHPKYSTAETNKTIDCYAQDYDRPTFWDLFEPT